MKKSPSARNASPHGPDRQPISVRRCWRNGDVEATVKLSRPQWRRICTGKTVTAFTWAWYEGKSERVGFRFNHPQRGDLFIGGEECVAYSRSTVAAAQITGVKFPPSLPDVTEFTVREGGTLEMSDLTPPATRAEAYDLPPHSLHDAPSLLAAAEVCQPLSRYLDRELEAAKVIALGPFPNPMAALYETYRAKAALESALPEWLSTLPQWELTPLMARVHAWLRAEPAWGQDDDSLPPAKHPQGAALEFFQAWDRKDRDVLKVMLVEGEHPGSTYYAAELHQDIDAANLTAWLRQLPVRFTRA